jgi:hypothetical protein
MPATSLQDPEALMGLADAPATIKRTATPITTVGIIPTLPVVQSAVLVSEATVLAVFRRVQVSGSTMEGWALCQETAKTISEDGFEEQAHGLCDILSLRHGKAINSSSHHHRHHRRHHRHSHRHRSQSVEEQEVERRLVHRLREQDHGIDFDGNAIRSRYHQNDHDTRPLPRPLPRPRRRVRKV